MSPEHAHASRFIPLVALILAVGAAALVTGCGPDSEAKSWGKREAPTADEAFQAGKDLPPTPRTLYAVAKVYRSQRRDAECEALLRRILAEQPRFLPAYCDLAEVQMQQRRIDDAQQTLAAGLRIAPKDPVLMNNLGMCRLVQADYQGALDAFTQAVAAVPHDPRYRANMAVVLGLLGREEESLALYEQVLSGEDAAANLTVLRRARQAVGPKVRATPASQPAEAPSARLAGSE